MFYEEVETLFDQSVNFQEVCRDQDGHCIFDIELRTVVLLNSRLFIVAIVTFLHSKLPSTIATSADAIENLVSLLLFFILFHRKNVVEEPLEDDCITVDRYVNFVLITDFLEALIKVLHVLN